MLLLAFFFNYLMNKKNHVPKNNMKQHNSFNTHKNQHITMISEGSCDTETGVMMLKIQRCVTEINSILKYFKIGNQY